MKRHTAWTAVGSGFRTFTDLCKTSIRKTAALIKTWLHRLKTVLWQREKTAGAAFVRVRKEAGKIGRTPSAAIHKSKKTHAEKAYDGEAPVSVRLKAIAIGQTLRMRTAGKGAMIAKVSLCTLCTLMGFAALLLCVYTIIPSVVSDISHFFEEDIAEAIYKRTLKDRDLTVFEQPMTELSSTPVRSSFLSVQKDNPDIIGRLTIDALQLGYLVVQHENNDYYTSMGYNRKKSNKGAIYLDNACDATAHPPKGHYLIYGHNMADGSMFGSLHRYLYAAFFENCGHIRFDTLYADFEWEVFSVYQIASGDAFAYAPYENAQQWLSYLQALSSKSLFPADITLHADDVLLTLGTIPSRSGEMIIVHARLLR